MFIRIEPSSAVPIYRQIMDQIRYQIATGVLTEGDKVPSVRQLAADLAVNQNTILKVYTELCRENVLRVERGSGTVVAGGQQGISLAERKRSVGALLREAAVQAIHMGLSADQTRQLLEREYAAIQADQHKNRSEKP